VEGISFLEPALAALGIDALPQLTVVDALELAVAHHPSFPPSIPALIAQIHSKVVAGEVKITLMAEYPDEHLVKLVHGAGTAGVLVEELPLHAIDQGEHIGLLTALYLPPLGENTSFEDFQELIAHLRAPEGCPWDREQTHQTLRTNLLEESYEALNAIDKDDPAEMQEEFGDLLLQIVLQAQIAAEYGEFTMSDVIHAIHAKLVRRHPHVFGDLELGEAEAVIKNWERLKEQERKDNGEEVKGLLDGIPVAMPSLSVADNYQRRAARVGFDWPDINGVIDKILEEVEEFRQAEDPAAQTEEFGDLLFALVNLARWIKVDPETALRETNVKFKRRFAVIEQAAKEQERKLSDMTLEEMDAIWEQSKKK
jgi:tetrapyrrole methylase family protein/MazG family protein